MQSFDIESLIGTGRESNGFAGISEKIPETETVKELTATKAITINELSAITSITKVNTSSTSSNFDRNLIKSEFLCDSASSRLHPGTSSTTSTTKTTNLESKCLGTAFHAYPCVSGSKSQSHCAPSSPSVSG
ncbi:unnamed protein product [Cercopithifilaria johnstoni]|uniref:Uncharacterized protein n=1 Tax=Cercopithifilaria johnstoni TaxID=2874296 RepID=A0A8J2M2R0_9BILA|nr:unnamed protein product [Cercopithifilaria johnstoni]